MPNHLRPNLDQLGLQGRSRPVLDIARERQPPQEVAQGVRQQEQLKADLIIHEVVAGQPRRVQGVLALFDPLLCRAAVVVKRHHVLRPPAEVGHDEPYAGEQLAVVPFHLGHHSAAGVPTGGLIRKTVVADKRPHRRPAHWPGQQVVDVPVQHVVGGETDGIGIAFVFEERVQTGLGKCRIAAKEPLDILVTVSGDHQLQHRPPLVGTVDVPVTEGGPLNVAELVEAKQGVVTHARKVAVVG